MSSRSDEFDRLVEEHARLMAGAIRRVCGRRHRSHLPDVEQEVRLALWKRLESGKKIEHPVSYIYKMALTAALAALRKLDRIADAVPPGSMSPENARNADTRNPRLLPAERAILLKEVLARLPRDQGRALRAYLAGFNHKEVAHLFGWSESVARHNIYRGLEALGREDDKEKHHA